MAPLPFTFDVPLPAGTRVSPQRLVADDGMESSAWLYEPAGAATRRVVLVLSHPRAEFGRHYAIPGLVKAGLSVVGHNARYLNNDIEGIPERILLDVGAALRWLRGEGFERIILVGNSGGGPLLATYLDVSNRSPSERPRETAAGGRIDLTGELPEAHGFIVVAAHSGEGKFLLGAIDPSVTDEADPLSCDPSLDMFHPDNGYDPATRTARYPAAFLERYRAAQRARVARIDDAAREEIAGERAARFGLGAAAIAGGYALLEAGRRATPHRLMLIYRTVANPAYLDLSIDPNDRDVGSIFGIVERRPEFGNYFGLNVARVLSPRAWLTTWSGLSSRVDFLKAAPALDVPTLFCPASGDSDILPAEAAAMWQAIGASDRERHDLVGADHYLRPTSKRQGRDPRAELVEVVKDWVQRRF